jgi:hypothetical protein
MKGDRVVEIEDNFCPDLEIQAWEDAARRVRREKWRQRTLSEWLMKMADEAR